MTMRIPTLLLAALLPLPLAALQDEEEKIIKELNFANDATKLAFQGQAIDRLRKRGPKMVPVLLNWVKAKGPNALSTAFTLSLADVVDPGVAGLCAELLSNKDFFWRPNAARALAMQKSAAHRDLLRSMLGDGLWGVRASAVLGLEKLGDKESAEAVRKLLDDPTYDVRAQAAKTLHAFGDASGLPVLVESLRSDVRWFDIDYGQLAREDACNFLKTLNGGDDFGFKAWETAEQRAPGLKKWEDWMAARDPEWRAKLPANAKVEPDRAKYVFGFELRSCQRGDYFFRIDTDGNLVVGYFNLARHPLAAEERAKLDAAIASVRKVPRGVPYGNPGCDFEQYYLAGDTGRFEKLWIGIRGRPSDLDGFVAAAAEILKAKAGAGESKEFRDRAALFREPD